MKPALRLRSRPNFPMTYLKDLIDIRDHVGRGDFVLRLSEGVTDPVGTVKHYQVTPPLVVLRMVPPSPTAQPWVESMKSTPQSDSQVPEVCVFQVAPAKPAA